MRILVPEKSMQHGRGGGRFQSVGKEVAAERVMNRPRIGGVFGSLISPERRYGAPSDEQRRESCPHLVPFAWVRAVALIERCRPTAIGGLVTLIG